MGLSRLLVIDDSLTVRKLVEIAFRGTAVTLDFAASGQEGIAKAIQTPPDVILLDFVLSDMKGPEVCRSLAARAHLANTPVVLMSAKNENVREQFVEFPFVIDFVAKPFTREQIAARIEKAWERNISGEKAGPSSKPATVLVFEKKEAAAKALFEHLKPCFAQIPDWFGEIDDANPSLYFAKRILTPERVELLLQAITPFVQSPIQPLQISQASQSQVLPASGQSLGVTGITGAAQAVDAQPVQTETTVSPAVAEPTKKDPSDSSQPIKATEAPSIFDTASNGLSGRLSGGMTIELLRMISAWQHSGQLLFRFKDNSQKTGAQQATNPLLPMEDAEESAVLLLVRSGTVILATFFDPAEYLRDSKVGIAGIPEEEVSKAENEQRASGKPVLVTLFEGGFLANIDLPTALLRQSRRVLRRLMAAPTYHFEWRESPVLPPFVESYGRAIPVAQLTLERLRDTVQWAKVERVVPSLQTLFDRADHFTQKIRQLHLSSGERRVLTLVDGQTSVQGIADKSGLEAKEVVHAIYRLAEADLVCRISNPARQKVMILEPDAEGFCKPLESLLTNRRHPVELAIMDAQADIAAAVIKERPSLVLVNVSVSNGSAERLANTLKAEQNLETRLVALVEPDDEGKLDGLVEAGFDAVLAKPIHLNDLERLLES